MNWFKMLWLNSEERKAILDLENKKTEIIIPKEEEEKLEPPYKNIYFSNNNITVSFSDGTILNKSNIDLPMFYRIKNSVSREAIESLMIDKSVYGEDKSSIYETSKEKKEVSENLDIFNNNKDFTVKGREVYLSNVNLALPAIITVNFIELLEKEKAFPYNNTIKDNIKALKMFWLKLALNSISQSREDLLLFCRKNNVRITRNGNLILYRKIVSKNGADKNLVGFITQNYYNIKKSGEDPRQFAINKENNNYELVNLNNYKYGDKIPFVNLQVAYLELPTFEENTFTSWHDKNMEIKLGGVYKIDEKKINLNNSICAAGGLHCASVDYDYSGFGDTSVVVLVNPSKAITVPTGETGKLRTTEMFVACVNDKPIGIHFDDSALSSFDEEYHDFSLNELEEIAKSKSFEKLSVQDNVPAISLVDINNIKDLLKNRVVNF